MAKMSTKFIRICAGTVAAVAVTGLGLSASATAATTPATVPAGFSATVFAHAGGKLSGADDIARLGDKLFVGYQNGVGSQGEPAANGTKNSTVVEFDKHGKEMAHWDVAGKVDGLGADKRTGQVIATVNEDGNSSAYTIDPDSKHHAVKHYHFSSLPHGGGTDNVSVRHGVVYIVASNPTADAHGSTANRPALYKVTFHGTTAKTTPVFDDNITATNLVTGKTGALNLTDPDSSTFVPRSVPGLGGSLLLDGQGDQQAVFVKHWGTKKQHTVVLPLSQQVDDTAFATSAEGTLYAVDSAKGTVVAITGHFTKDEAFVSAKGGLGTLSLKTGTITAFGNAVSSPKGLLFAAADRDDRK
ncbi:hypothetical protein A6P39_012040 [Streptomyces sp. FXJ1.172]|uniref:hypothetical protein n=1 Tax=Streptomyces sp. FXJ1.172 TaxID=710705 RepID=UPI0007CF2B81|nr:hypothetical protein [Streptomyces sp. FXJ1.172]WEO94674.1 hypothetical protein A6P39_012040 [Streptomyces sp. FXJ1.172]